MTLLLSIIAFVVIFSLLILVHEFGHFIAAKKSGIKVEEFGLGIPPKIWGFKPKKSETLYSLNAIPFGGFVRLYGEDSSNAKVVKSPRSFAAQPAGIKILVVVAGVLMNFLLAFLLLTIGMLVGMQPLFVTPDDVYAGINSGVIRLEEGMMVKEAFPSEFNFQQNDKILTVDGNHIQFGDEITSLKDNQPVVFEVLRNGGAVKLTGVYHKATPPFKLYDVLGIPRLVIKNIQPDSALAKSGVQSGDRINSINDQQVFNTADLNNLISSGKALNFTLYRAGQLVQMNIPGRSTSSLIISGVLPASPAEKAGLRAEDEIISINDQKVSSMEDVMHIMSAGSKQREILYQIKRAGTWINFNVEKDQNGMIGVLLSDLHEMGDGGFSYYMTTVPSSVISIADVRYSWWEAPVKAFTEMQRLSVVTVKMFVNVFSQMFTKLTVPEGVAGPIGIAQMTYTFVQEGFMSLLRFTALLSLSLGIINILPFPGLDGGRFFLIVLSLIMRKKIDSKIEAYIHFIGFLFLMLLIFMITFNDVMRIFS